MTTTFNIGDTVWVAHAGQQQKQVICPDCLGQLALTVIMGDGSHVSIACAGCSRGYEAPSGFVTEYEYQALAQSGTVTGVTLSGGAVQYRVNDFHQDTANIYATKDAAEQRAAALREQRQAEERKKIESQKEHRHRTWAWNAHYHRNALKRAKQEVEYHTAKLNVAKAKTAEQKVKVEA